MRSRRPKNKAVDERVLSISMSGGRIATIKVGATKSGERNFDKEVVGCCVGNANHSNHDLETMLLSIPTVVEAEVSNTRPI